VTDKKGDWAIIGLGTSMDLTAEADGFLLTTMDIQVKQLARNPAIAVVMKKPAPRKSPWSGTSLPDLVEQANKLYDEGNYDGAMARFRRSWRRTPASIRST
jgi:hypothetical protein